MQFATKFLCTVGLLALASGNLIDVKKHKPAILAKQTPAHVEIDKIETEMELKGIELEEIKHPGHVRPSDVEYAGGPIMHVANLHNIFFGGWNSETVNIITDFTSNLANTPYFNTITTYYDANGYIRNDTAILKSTTFVNDNFLGDPVTALNSVLDNFLVPEETDGLYNLFFNGVIPPLFAELGACGFHDWTTRNGKQIIYTVQTNPLQDMNFAMSCGLSGGPTANGDAAADNVVNILGHEIIEAMTDPIVGYGWFSPVTGYENSDNCAWKFGPRLPNNPLANIHLGNRDYLLQKQWVHKPPHMSACRTYLRNTKTGPSPIQK